MNGITAHVRVPSNAWMPVMPWSVNSSRRMPGRLRSIVIGASMPGPIVIVPVTRMVLSFLSLSRPPQAS
jgi:hypothetical protein